MSIYLRNKEHWSIDLAHDYSMRLAKKLNLRITSRNQNSSVIRYTYEYKGIELRSSCNNFEENGTDRGGLVKQYTHNLRRSPCWEPFETFVIDYTGYVMPCCNLLSDKPEHKEYIVSNLLNNREGIFDIYAGKLSSWRRSMVTFGEKQKPCSTCGHRDISDKISPLIAPYLDKKLATLKFNKV